MKKIYINMADLNFKQIYFEITNKCNMQCGYCFNSSMLMGERFIKLDKLSSLFENMVFAVNEPNIFISGGEPLLHPDIIKLVSYFTEEKNGQVTLLTNGCIIDKVALELYPSNLNWQIGSAMLANKSLYQENCSKYCDNIKKIIQYFPNSTITLAYTITYQNYMFLDEFLGEFAPNEKLNILLSFVQERGRCVDVAQDFLVPPSVKLELIKKYAKYSPSVRFCGVSLDKDISEIIFFGKKESTRLGCEECIECYVDYNNTVHFCSKIDRYLLCKQKNLTFDSINHILTFELVKCIESKCINYRDCVMRCLREGDGICKRI